MVEVFNYLDKYLAENKTFKWLKKSFLKCAHIQTFFRLMHLNILMDISQEKTQYLFVGIIIMFGKN